MISVVFSHGTKGKFVEWKGEKSLLDVTFCIHLVREIFIFREKSENFESDVLEHVKSCPHAVENPK